MTPSTVTDRDTTGIPATLAWVGDEDGYLRLIDQTRLPGTETYLDCRTVEQVWQAIKILAVRGAPAIGVSAGYGLVIGLRDSRAADQPTFAAKLHEVGEYLCSSRPTAVNLAWAVDRLTRLAEDRLDADCAPLDVWRQMLAEAHVIAREDAEICRRIGEVGAELIPSGGGVLTHCNAGALATSAYGTALSLMYVAHEQGRRFKVFADETRPLLQGARLTAFELAAAGIDVTVICDGVAASLMRAGQIQVVVVGADRIAANGDVANKIGTYSVAVAAAHHDVPFYVAAPQSTFDLTLGSGDEIPIEQRDEDEVRKGFGAETVSPRAGVYNPAFDVTPAALVRGIITEKGLLEPVSKARITEFFGAGACNGV